MKKGFIAGAFDLLHPGHILLLQDCKERCDLLIVGLQVNPHLEREEKNTPVQTLAERWIQLMGCEYVDIVIAYETEQDLEDFLRALKPHVRFLGADYVSDGKKITGETLVTIEYLDRSHRWSSTELRERIRRNA